MYSTKTVEQARTKDLIVFLGQRGYTFTKKGGEYRCKQHPSFAVSSDRLSWYWHSKGVGGYGALDYLTKVEGLKFRAAVERLETVPPSPLVQVERVEKTLVLPERANILSPKLYNYLCKTRGIDSGIVAALIQEGKIYEDKRGNVVFVGYGEQGVAKFACLRGTSAGQFRMDCPGSDKRYSFKIGGGEGKLYVFEAPIDALSHATLENYYRSDKNAWRNDTRLSLGGTSGLALDKYLEIHPNTKEIVLCLDNDEAGRSAAVNMARRLTDIGFFARLELPQGKDYNDDLMVYRAVRQKMRDRHYEI